FNRDGRRVAAPSNGALDNRTLSRKDYIDPVRSGLDPDRRAHRNSLKQFAHVAILQRDTTPGPVAPGAVTMNVNIAAEARVLRRSLLSFQRVLDFVVLRFRDQTLP